MATLTGPARLERDALIQQIVAAAAQLHTKRLIRHCDLTVEQDEYGAGGSESDSPTDVAFFLTHTARDYRLRVTLAVRAQDR